MVCRWLMMVILVPKTSDQLCVVPMCAEIAAELSHWRSFAKNLWQHGNIAGHILLVILKCLKLKSRPRRFHQTEISTKYRPACLGPERATSFWLSVAANISGSVIAPADGDV